MTRLVPPSVDPACDERTILSSICTNHCHDKPTKTTRFGPSPAHTPLQLSPRSNSMGAIRSSLYTLHFWILNFYASHISPLGTSLATIKHIVLQKVHLILNGVLTLLSPSGMGAHTAQQRCFASEPRTGWERLKLSIEHGSHSCFRLALGGYPWIYALVDVTREDDGISESWEFFKTKTRRETHGASCNWSLSNLTNKGKKRRSKKSFCIRASQRAKKEPLL